MPPPPLLLNPDVAGIVDLLCAPASTQATHPLTSEHLRALLKAHTQDAHANFDSMQLAALQQLVYRNVNMALVLPAAGGRQQDAAADATSTY
jgi:hypothetical protein